ncbi:cation diffusion facilitator family transporter [Oceanobacillus polygoni]|uniref:Cobalt-zinc-cadmium efflux system protein n=1 Tax=Oceanobacillus polygoni TaxID=1235259 RepID=A0A9X0YVG5_9BACI|nr:cation diffusion facilitator family transporter [Oceanobacillus polygoni]MBP2077924.1 cobalt-zinc-cadmium efflux system protein [Oceanobacillus polygoni]
MGHHHDHGHEHSHGHHHHTSNTRVLFWSFILIFTFMIVEAIGGILTNSLALLSDAGHMLSDAAALGLSLLAFKIGEKKATGNKTFGYKRFEIIAAFINGLTLIIISLYIFYEAFHRFAEPPEVSGSMMIIAFIGLCVNILVAWLLMRGDAKENLNIRSALLHVLGDLLGSVGALTAGLFIILFGWNIADPIASVLVAILIVISGFRVTRDSLHILMEGKPANIDVDLLKNSLMELNGVEDVHDIHVWSITSEFPSMSCHLVVDKTVDRDQLLQTANDKVKTQFNINHSTFQIEGIGTHFHNSCDSCD